MTAKRDEPYNPNIKSRAAPAGLMFRIATLEDCEALSCLMAERNLHQSAEFISKQTEREIGLNETDPKYRLFVAELLGRVVGLCRYFHSSGLPIEKIRFPAPAGWYCMGILVSADFRRQGIARFLFQERLKSLKEHGATTIYSVVDANNLASVRMHQEFGFKETNRAAGFLHIAFESGSGIFYEMEI